MTRTFAAALFALLAITAQARAAPIDLFSVDLDFQYGYTHGGVPTTYTMCGITGFSVDPSNGNYYFADADLTFVRGAGTGGPTSLTGSAGLLEGPGNSNTPPVTNALLATMAGPIPFAVNTSTFPNLTFSDFTLGETQRAFGGTVTACPSSGTCAVTPIPAAFPLFASALAGLGGFGWWKRRGKVSRCR